jgi:hypothetical protein
MRELEVEPTAPSGLGTYAIEVVVTGENYEARVPATVVVR